MIKKAIITAAGKGTRQYPATNTIQKEMFPLVDIDGIAKPVIQIIAEQAVRAGIESICIVVNPGESDQFKQHFTGLNPKNYQSFKEKGKEGYIHQSEILSHLEKRITYMEQIEQHGFGHAVWCAREFVADDPFLLLLGDHVYISDKEISCITQTLQGFERVRKTLFPVIRTSIEQLHLFGTLTGLPVHGQSGLYRVTEIIEKPNPETAKTILVTQDLPRNQFFTFFGMYALSPEVMQILDSHVKENVRSRGEIQLTPALQELAAACGAFALEIEGQRLDMGTPLGYIKTQMALARKGAFSQEVEGYIQGR
ncbi:nucleotidyl transferase [bacterium]|nr:nucleotidyl transferase [bacterium]